MKLSIHYNDIREYEARLAPGSETALLGDWLERMREVAGGKLPRDRGAWHEIEIPDEEAAWWIAAYAKYEECDGQIDTDVLYNELS